MTQDEIVDAAARLRETGLPDFLNRWLAMTPEAVAANEEARARIRESRFSTSAGASTASERSEKGKAMNAAVIGTKEKALRAARAETADETTRRVMIEAVDGPKTNLDQALAAAQGRTVDAAFLGPDLPAMPATKESSVKTPKTKEARGPTKTASKPRKPAAERRAKPKGADPKAAKENARTPVSGRLDCLREGSKQAVMLDMALREEGATEAAMCKKLGWKKCRVTLKRVCEKVGAVLKVEKNKAEETVFFASFPKGKPALQAAE